MWKKKDVFWYKLMLKHMEIVDAIEKKPRREKVLISTELDRDQKLQVHLSKYRVLYLDPVFHMHLSMDNIWLSIISNTKNMCH